MVARTVSIPHSIRLSAWRRARCETLTRFYLIEGDGSAGVRIRIPTGGHVAEFDSTSHDGSAACSVADPVDGKDACPIAANSSGRRSSKPSWPMSPSLSAVRCLPSSSPVPGEREGHRGTLPFRSGAADHPEAAPLARDMAPEGGSREAGREIDRVLLDSYWAKCAGLVMRCGLARWPRRA